jgi:hypothetical protein
MIAHFILNLQRNLFQMYFAVYLYVLRLCGMCGIYKIYLARVYFTHYFIVYI